MLYDASIEVECDDCHTFETVPLTATARGGWDERNVASYLTRLGWLVEGDKHYCKECKVHHL